MVYYQRKYQILEYYPSESFFIQAWQKISSIMSDAEFKEEMREFIRQILDVQPTRILIDMRDFGYVVNQEFDSWIADNINRKIAQIAGHKVAFVYSQDMMTKLSVESVLEKYETDFEFNKRYFASIEQAKDWLFD